VRQVPERLGGLEHEPPHAVGRRPLGEQRVGDLLAEPLLVRKRPLEQRDARRGSGDVRGVEGQGGEGRGVAVAHEGGAPEELVPVAHPLPLELLPRRGIEEQEGPLGQVLVQGIARHAGDIGTGARKLDGPGEKPECTEPTSCVSEPESSL
jgi:hypothetical protein